MHGLPLLYWLATAVDTIYRLAQLPRRGKQSNGKQVRY